MICASTVCLTLCGSLLPLSAAINDPVKVDGGLVSGTSGYSSEVRVFKGVPFAAPPIGLLRWRAPEPVAKWDGVRKAVAMPAICADNPYLGRETINSILPPVSEDCLYLNVWTAAQSAGERRPVMVWIYGGVLERASVMPSTYDGEELAKKGVVLVTFNYRVGIFGLLAHPELSRESIHHTSGNYWFLDQLAALEWVQRNISAFGGDPKRVTIIGQGAGSWSVNLLTASPLAKGLFQRAIGESGANFEPMTKRLPEMELAGAIWAQFMGADSMGALRARSADEIRSKAPGAFPRLAFLGYVDGWVLPEEVYAIYSKGKQNDVPVLIGSNADEGTAFTPSPFTIELFGKEAQRRFGRQAEEYLKLYPVNSDAEAWASWAATYRDEGYGWPMRTWARMQTKTGKSKAHLYYFSHVPPGPIGNRFGAYHSAEVNYVFHNLEPSNRIWQAVDRKLADMMSSYWVNFAATGDPNGKGLPKWPAYEQRTDLLMEFGDEVTMRPVPHKAQLDFFEAYNNKLRN